ncbi:winged helix-turn-helix transcriptional regulator [Amycolatopsis taiwanensis]|uniref:winged helix-turn-helix transcriptional regulator n=1 Tax=Amycolatopsis taiwanensis TaxID=342230 RepID=UPI001B80BC05|nr:winged helix-turn-helix transcriptional regulator [Amycolatopsis taiwanensis]
MPAAVRSPGHPLPRPATAPLRRLQFNGLVDRHAHPDAPSGVEYELTALGRTLLAPIELSAPGPSSTAMTSWQPRKQRAFWNRPKVCINVDQRPWLIAIG